MTRKFVEGGLRENNNGADLTKIPIPNEFDGSSSGGQTQQSHTR
jgi:hypothetical protein